MRGSKQSSTLNNTVRESSVSDCNPKEPSSCSPTHACKNNELVITSIQATDIALGLRRIPASFYILVQHSNLEWRTENNRSSANNNVIEWDEPIPIPSDLSATVCLQIHASFEFQPVLGNGELLRQLTTTGEQLLDRSTKDLPFTFFPKDGDVVSPCSSLLVTVRRWKCEISDLSMSRGLDAHCSITECRSQLKNATDEVHRALSRCEKRGDKRDLERSIERFERTLNICPLGHPCRAAVKSNLVLAKIILYKVNKTSVSLDVPLALYYRALSARPVGHSDRPSMLIDLAILHLARFGKRQGEGDAAQAEALLRQAMELGFADSHEKWAASGMLQLCAGRKLAAVRSRAKSSMQQDSHSGFTNRDLRASSAELLKHYQQFGDLGDLQQALTHLETLVRSASLWDPEYPGILQNYGAALLERFGRLGELGDLERAISKLADGIQLTPDGHPDKPALLSNLGSSFVTRFQRLGELGDLERAISTLADAVRLTPDGHPDKAARLSNLGASFATRFERLGELGDLERAISRLADAVRLTPDGHPDRPALLGNLGNSFKTRFERLGEFRDLERAISRQADAVGLTPDGHPDKPGRLNNLGNSFVTRFRRFGELGDLERAISTLADAVRLTPDGHPDKPAWLNNLGTSFVTRFQRLGELGDLERAISTLADAVQLTPDHHPNKPALLGNLGNSFETRFKRLGDLGDLERAISRLVDAIQLTPDGHPDRPSRLSNLGSSFKTRFQRLGNLGDLERAISALADAVQLTPDGHPNKPALLGNLGNSFLTHFEHLGHLGDLEQAISTLADAVRLTPDGHPDRPTLLSNLGSSFVTRFERLGELGDLERAISRQADAVRLTPDGHPDRPTRLNNIGTSFITRFKRLGELGDLERAISTLADAVQLTPDGHPNKPCLLGNLGSSFKTRFERLGDLGDLGDLERAISRQADAIQLTPDGHPDRPSRLSNLGTSFATRFERLGNLGDLERAISRLADAVQLTPDGRPDKPVLLGNLGNSFKTRFKRLRELEDLERAISTLADAVRLTPDGHPDKPGWLSNLGDSFVIRFKRLADIADLEQAISLFSHSTSYSTGPPTVRFIASLRWISCARASRHHSLLHAYSIAVGLLPQLAWLGLSLSHRYHELMQGPDVIREAAAAAAEFGYPETAVEWLEQGRSIVWGELFQLRSSYDELSAVHPDHARRLRDLSNALEQASLTHEKSLLSMPEIFHDAEHHVTASLYQEADKHRALAIERDNLLEEIRELPGFKHFLLHKEFSRLRASAHSGPVVILNAADSRCDALIVLAGVENVVHVPLPSFTLEICETLQSSVKCLTREAPIHLGERVGNCVLPKPSSQWEPILSRLWKCVVKPVVDALGFSTIQDLTRIFWCPTGPFTFLPIHAAGFYDSQHSQSVHKVFDFVVSSYVPTLGILAPSPEPRAASSDNLQFLAVRQPQSDGLSHLPGVAAELKRIREVIMDSPSARVALSESSVGTVKEVLDLMKNADWVHFACHGIQDATNPTESGLCLANNRRLQLSNIIELRRPRGGLAFLSACQTATGDKKLSDEAVHIAAGMLFAGYGGVVGTMWSISDRLAPNVAQDVYRQLFSNGTRPDYREAARALQDAVRRLRDDGASFSEWIPFIHVGL